MSSFAKAMTKYFKAANESSAPAPNSELKAGGEKLVRHQAQVKSGVDAILSENDRVSRNIALPMVKLDLTRLKAKGIETSDSVNHQTLEEYRNIKRPLLQNAFGQGRTLVQDGNLVMVTSAIAGEGKSFTSINLALSIARELDRTVLLIDADVSRHGISRMLGIENHKGLTDILSGHTLGVTDVLVKFDEPKLRLLPAGHKHPHVAELLASENMRCLTEEMAKRYSDRLILFDAPPLLEASETRVLAGLVGQILLIVEAERTTQFMVQEAISYLDRSKAIGLLLNKSQQKLSSAYSYGYYDPNTLSR